MASGALAVLIVMYAALVGVSAQECDPDVCANPWATQSVSDTAVLRVKDSSSPGGTRVQLSGFAQMAAIITTPGLAGSQQQGVTDTFFISMSSTMSVNGYEAPISLAALCYFDMSQFQWYIQATFTNDGQVSQSGNLTTAPGTDLNMDVFIDSSGGGLTVTIDQNGGDQNDVEFVTGITPDSLSGTVVTVGFAGNNVNAQDCSVLPNTFSAQFTGVALHNADGSTIPLGLTGNTPSVQACDLAIAVDNDSQTATVSWQLS